MYGAAKALQLRPPLCLEFWPYGLKRSESYDALKRALTESGYNLFYDLDGSQSARPLSPQSLDDLYAKLGEGGAYTDVLVLRKN